MTNRTTYLFIALCFVATNIALAQGRVIGRVVDERGEPVGGATVSLIGKNVAVTQAAISNGQGYYVLLGVQEGGYEMRVKRKGYPEWKSEIAVVASVTKRMDIKLGESPDVALKASPASDREKNKQQEQQQQQQASESIQYNVARDIEVSAIASDAGLLSALRSAEEFAKIEESVAVPDKEIELVGGIESLYKKIIYPFTAERARIEGQVVAKVYVDESGYITQISLVKSAHPLLNAEVLRVITEDAKFIPASIKGKPVKSAMIIPIRFSLK
jgi:TonB family protein